MFVRYHRVERTQKTKTQLPAGNINRVGCRTRNRCAGCANEKLRIKLYFVVWNKSSTSLLLIPRIRYNSIYFDDGNLNGKWLATSAGRGGGVMKEWHFADSLYFWHFLGTIAHIKQDEWEHTMIISICISQLNLKWQLLFQYCVLLQKRGYTLNGWVLFQMTDGDDDDRLIVYP